MAQLQNCVRDVKKMIAHEGDDDWVEFIDQTYNQAMIEKAFEVIKDEQSSVSGR